MRTIGFDLDMTLIDSRPGVAAVYEALAAETATPIDVEAIVNRLGPPLESELAHWYPAEDVDRMADRYRALYPALALDLVAPMPGAPDALAAARDLGRVLVITAKATENAVLHVERLGVPGLEVFGGVWRDAKAEVLRAEGGDTYVGDHVHDMDAARLAEVTGVAVATGPCSADELAAAGAATVLTTLEAFRPWLEQTA